MKKTWIYLLLIALLAVVVVVIVLDFNASKVGNLPDNKYELNKDSLYDGDGWEVSWKESLQIKFSAEKVFAIDAIDDKIYVALDDKIKVLNLQGELLNFYNSEGRVRALNCGPDSSLLVAYGSFIVQLDKEGKTVFKSDEMDEDAVFTSLAYKDKQIFVADAGNRKVLVFNFQGEKTGEFKGVYSSDNEDKGFIVPSAFFDLEVNQQGELWVVNPGLHTLQHYSPEGDLINFWEKAGNNIEGFIGCCNPAQMTILPDGRFLTSEKKMIRIKIYSKEGELEEVVALPESFKDKGKAPEVVFIDDKIYALDFENKMIRVFEHK